MVMKKPSRRSCTVCPKNKHHGDSDHEGGDDVEHRKVSKRHSRKVNNRFRNNRRATNRNVIHRIDAKKKAARLAAARRANIKAVMARKRAKQRTQTHHQPRTIRPLAIKALNQYYGLDHQTEVPHPRTGDTFTNMITGEVRLFNKGVWNLIPTPPGPRSYYSEGIARDDLIPEPREGDLYIQGSTNQISVYQNDEWNVKNFVSHEKQERKKIEVENQIIRSESAREGPGKLKISLPLRHKLSEMAELDQIPTLGAQSFKLNFEKNQALLEGTYVNLSTETFEKIFPSIHNNQATLQVLPQGVINVVLKFPRAHYLPIEFNLENWIKYSDANAKLWQTVTCLADFEVFDSDGQAIEDYQLIANHQNKLVNLTQFHKTITTLSPHETVILKSEKGISQVSWKSKLLAYPVGGDDPKEFYAVQFNDLKKAISLPKLGVKVNI